MISKQLQRKIDYSIKVMRKAERLALTMNDDGFKLAFSGGKEIYEGGGDIISDGEFSHIVSYSLNDARFVVIRIEHFTDEIERVMNMNRVYQEWLTKYDKKVIGNIHDNPELIERESK